MKSQNKKSPQKPETRLQKIPYFALSSVFFTVNQVDLNKLVW